MTVRGRWVQDEQGELHEEPSPRGSDPKKETEEQIKKREQAERDAHPGNYI